MATPLSTVGLQVWRGALLLADYLFAMAATWAGCTALELGSGPGLAGLALASSLGAAPARVFLTDSALAGGKVLQQLATNLEANADRLGCPVAVRELDWQLPPAWLLSSESSPATQLASVVATTSAACAAQTGLKDQQQQFSWRVEDVQQLQCLDVILAADCVYSDELTDALMKTAVLLMRQGHAASGRSPVLLVALEKRICFTLDDLDVRAPAYDHWRKLFTPAETATDKAEAVAAAEPMAAGRPAPPFLLVGRRLDTAILPQRVAEYERTKELELWELRLASD